MVVMVALLRGVNVGGSSTVAMSELRRTATACGYEGVRTYIQSGNLVFSTRTASTRAVAVRLRDAIAEATDVRPEVIVRTRAQLASVVDQNPFVQLGKDAAHLHVVFTGGAAEAFLEPVDLARYAPEAAVAAGQQLYLYLPGGMGRSKLAADIDRRKAGPSRTTRNWRTVNKLLEVADEIA